MMKHGMAKSACFLFLISVLAASLALPQATTVPPTPKTPPKTPPQTATKAPATQTATPKAGGTTAATAKKTTATIRKATATGKTSKTTAKKNGPPAQTWRNRQAAPTSSRYKEIQQALADKGYLKAEANGVWDAQSEEALKQFQTEKNLPPTGKITSQSLIGLGLGPKAPDPITTPPKPDATPPASNP
jgi:Putative peptidoglycan binding domain